MSQLLTHSRQDAFKTCRKKHYFSYELGIRQSEDAKPLRMGSAYHEALEVIGNGGDLSQATEAIYKYYDEHPNQYDQYEWEIERETVLRLLCGYVWRWENCHLTHVATEMSFNIPLLNPETGAASKVWDMAGKIDGIVTLEDGRLAVMEHKLLSEDLSSDSLLWKRLRIEHQISLYVVAARRLGYHVESVLYDVTCKPTIKPSQVAILDENGAKIVLDAHGDRVRTERGLYRQTGDTSKGYVLQQRPMTAEEWGEKLSADIAEKPEKYYARQEVPRLDQDLSEYEYELWDIQRTIREAQLNDRHYRTCNKNTCSFCSYFSICTNGWKAGDTLPDGFVQLQNLHPELTGETTNVNSNTTAETGIASTSPTA